MVFGVECKIYSDGHRYAVYLCGGIDENCFSPIHYPKFTHGGIWFQISGMDQPFWMHYPQDAHLIGLTL